MNTNHSTAEGYHSLGTQGGSEMESTKAYNELMERNAKHRTATYKMTDELPWMKQPSMDTLNEWLADGYSKTTDGCITEPDGACPHNKLSWLIVLGMI